MFPVLTRPRGFKKAILESISELATLNEFRTSEIFEGFEEPKRLCWDIGDPCAIPFEALGDVLVRTRSAHDLGAALISGEAAFEV